MKRIPTNELKKILKEVKEVAEKAGSILIKYQKKIHSLDICGKEAQGVVSEADIKAEKFILKELKKKRPSFGFMAEESWFMEGRGDWSQFTAGEDCLWVIDPLDGTTNFLNGMDYFAVCIGLMVKGKAVLGVIYRPQTGDFYWAIDGVGAYLENSQKKMRKKKLEQRKVKKNLRECLLVTGFATEKGKVFDNEFRIFKKIMSTSRGIRRMGSAALDLCHVAQGIFDGFWERGLAPWDTCAAMVICQEAGIKVTDYNGRKYSPFGPHIVASHPSIHTKMVGQVSG